MATHRKLTAAERALAERYLAIEAGSARLGARLLLVIVVGVIALGCFVRKDTPEGALFCWCLAAALLLFAYFIQGLANLRVDDRAYRVRGVCRSKFVPKQGTFHLLGGNQVALSPGWDSFWVDGAEIEVDVCHIVKANANVPTFTLLLSLPPLSAELPPLPSQGNGWLALNAITLALAFIAGLALGAADSEEVLGAALYLNAPKRFASVSELLRQGEVPAGVEIEIARAYRVALDAESYLVELHEDERENFAPLSLPSSDDSVSASAQAAEQERFNRALLDLRERVLAKPHDSLFEQGEGHLPGSVEPVENVRGIVRKSPVMLTFWTGATSGAAGVLGRFLAAVVAFGVTLALWLRRQRTVNRARLDWQRRVVGAL